MAILNIVTDGEPILRKTCKPVGEITPRIKRLLDDMRDTLIDSEGVGLAAPQVGVLKRIVLVDTGDRIVEFINPEIVGEEGEQEGLEGCLSVPGKWGITKRPAKVTVRALNRNGEEFEITGEDIVARCFCHELDHLEGHLFTEKVTRFLTQKEVEEYVEKGGAD